MLDTLSEFVATFGPIALAAMGVIVSIIPNLARRNERWLCVAAFLAVGAVVCAANFYELHSANSMQHDIWESETGGDNFCYLDALSDDSDNSPNLRLVVVNPGNVPIYNFRTTILEEEDLNGVHDITTMQTIPIAIDNVHPGVTPVSTAFLTGKVYWANIEARNGRFFEEMLLDYKGALHTKAIRLFKLFGSMSKNGIVVPERMQQIKIN